jgi:TonB family protein
MYQLMSGAYRYHACALRELDRIPTPKKIVKPIYPVEMAKSGHHGRVVVDFYIDESGRVRMPAVSLETTRNDEELATAAVTAVSQWEFEPPVSHGRPALVAIQQEFNFQGKD